VVFRDLVVNRDDFALINEHCLRGFWVLCPQLESDTFGPDSGLVPLSAKRTPLYSPVSPSGVSIITLFVVIEPGLAEELKYTAVRPD